MEYQEIIIKGTRFNKMQKFIKGLSKNKYHQFNYLKILDGTATICDGYSISCMNGLDKSEKEILIHFDTIKQIKIKPHEFIVINVDQTDKNIHTLSYGPMSINLTQPLDSYPSTKEVLNEIDEDDCVFEVRLNPNILANFSKLTDRSGIKMKFSKSNPQRVGVYDENDLNLGYFMSYK